MFPGLGNWGQSWEWGQECSLKIPGGGGIGGAEKKKFFEFIFFSSNNRLFHM
jgi:hypothetical protein